MQIPRSDLKLYLGREEITVAVQRLAREIDLRFEGHDLVILGLLRGSFVFYSDLTRLIKTSLVVEFLRVPEELKLDKFQIPDGVRKTVQGKTVLIVDDIIRTGKKMREVRRALGEGIAKEVHTCALFVCESARLKGAAPDLAGFELKQEYLVGYGLDNGEGNCGLPDVHCTLERPRS